MSEPRRLGDLLPSLDLNPKQVTKAAASRPAPYRPFQSDLFQIETRWVPILRVLAQAGILARIGPYAVAAYIALKCSADLRSGQVHISTNRIAEKSGMSERAARTALKTLEQAGLVSVVPRPGCSKTFQIVERIPFWSDQADEPAGEVHWDFSSIEWAEQLRKVAASVQQLVRENDGANKSQTITIGQININVQINTPPRPNRP